MVEELQVGVSHHDLRELLLHLTPNGTDELWTCLCPKLRDFRMQVVYPWDNKIVSDFVKSRTSSASNNCHDVPLKSIRFTGAVAEPALLFKGLQVPDDLEVFTDNMYDWRR